MADRQETVADIIAEMKREAAKIFPALPIAVLQLATRLEAACLEAAWKRERELTKSPENVNSGAASDSRGNSGDSAKLREAPEEIKLTREEERAIDKKLGPNFKKDMNEFAQKLQNLMVEFPMAQGHSKEARYLQQPFYMMSGALHLTKRFCMTEQERDEDDDVIASIPRALDALAGAFGGSGRQENKDGGNDGNEQQTA